jgi:hypothetical protein
MDNEPFIISIKVNRIYFIKTLINSGCLAYDIIS